MLVLEDLHWIDAETQALLNVLVDSVATARILLLVNFRPEYRHEWSTRVHYTQRRLDPLGAADALELLDAMLGPGISLAPVKNLIIERTDGNPFFMEEMVQTLFEQGALERRAGGTVAVARAPGSLRMPATVRGILAARIDRLRPDLKELLQTLAVIGKEFRVQLIRRVAPIGEERLLAMLTELQAGEFIFEQPAAADLEYSFKHALTQEVAYDSVLLQRRRAIHERTAAAFEELYSERIEDCLSELANHYGKSGNAAKAIDYFERAGEQARARSAYDDAIRNWNAALEVLGTTSDGPARTIRELGLCTSLGAILISVRGFTDPEVQPMVARARLDFTGR